MKDKIVSFLKSQIVSSLFFAILGFCLIVMPVTMVNLICKIIFGIVLMATGLYHIILYIKANRNPNLFDLFSGVLVLVLGGFLFFNPQVVVKLLPILLGAFVLIDSIWIFQGCIDLKKNHRAEWKGMSLINIIFVILAVVLVCNPFSQIKVTIIFAGWVICLNGIVDIVFLILRNRKKKYISSLQENIHEETTCDRKKEETNMDDNEIPEKEETDEIGISPEENVSDSNMQNEEKNKTEIVEQEKSEADNCPEEKQETDSMENTEEQKSVWNGEILEEWKD